MVAHRPAASRSYGLIRPQPLARAQLALRAPSWRPADTRLGAAHRQRIEKGRKLREAGIESKNRCHACGEPKRGHICFQKLRGGPQVDLRSPVRQGSIVCLSMHQYCFFRRCCFLALALALAGGCLVEEDQ